MDSDVLEYYAMSWVTVHLKHQEPLSLTVSHSWRHEFSTTLLWEPQICKFYPHLHILLILTSSPFPCPTNSIHSGSIIHINSCVHYSCFSQPTYLSLLLSCVLETEWDDDDLAAQVVLFFLAGFDTASTLLCFAAHLLATHPDVQSRLQEEIDMTLNKDGGHGGLRCGAKNQLLYCAWSTQEAGFADII